MADLETLLAGLTLEEKAALCVGRDAWTTQPVERLGLPALWLADGPNGLRKTLASDTLAVGEAVPATCFPTASALGATWDAELVEAVGAAVGAEARAQDVAVVLGPGVNLKRSPLGGRSFEYLSEDPVLSGRLAAALVRGVQGAGVGACLKHFVANEAETDRMTADSVLDERTLREVYALPFEIAIREAGPWTVMAAYNQVNGEPASESRALLRDLLVDGLGFDGLVMSDWHAITDRAAGVAAGCHLQMPHAPTAGAVVEAVRAGRLDEADLDRAVAALQRLAERVREGAARPAPPVDHDTHHALARRAATEAITLLKNEPPGLLPLAEGARVALLGSMARDQRFQGAGSSEVVPTRVERLHEALDHAAWAGEDDLEGARAAARDADVAVVMVGLPGAYETEGEDRPQLGLPPEHDALVEAVLEVQPRTVVVLVNGAAVAMPWAARVPAIVEAWLGGQAAGGALADVLTGRADPGGRLSETFPARLQDTPAHLTFPGDGDGRTHYAERLWTGHRWYDARGIAPLFPFGHGLSYTSFGWSDLRADGLDVTLTVRNEGDRAGTEVVQLYVRECEPALRRPERLLHAFAKVRLGPGEAADVALRLDPRLLAVWDPRVPGWRAGGGAWELLLGASSRDIRLRATVDLDLGPGPRAIFGPLTPLRDWLADERGRPLVEPAIARIPALAEAGDSPLMRAFVAGLPVRKLVTLGGMSEDELRAALDQANAAA